MWTIIVVMTSLVSVQIAEHSNNDLDRLTELMSGHFSSAAQAAEDSAYFDISLIMHPIWTGDKKARWLYVEQAVASMKDQPYRQRIYRLSKGKKGVIESRVYELPDPESYIEAWKNPSRFDGLKPSDLIEREGCSVYLSKDGNGCFTGSTNDRDCISSLRGATYATSRVTVCAGSVTSWDQGWDSEDKQVWGAVDGPYVFDLIDAGQD